MLVHPCSEGFIAGVQKEWSTLWGKGTFQPTQVSAVKGIQILPLMWVFKYKYDAQGFVTGYKARLCVRGDLQKYWKDDVYAATLAGKSFRSIIATAAKWDLELRQYDAVNAFTNGQMDELIYVWYPDGFKRDGWCLLLLRALYGLRRSPVIWQRELTGTFKKLGLT